MTGKQRASDAVTVAITGGLGNQMFQYAAGRALAIRLGVPLKLDLAFYRKSRRGLFRHGPIADLKRAWMKHRERRRRKRLAGLRGNRWMTVPFAGRKP